MARSCTSLGRFGWTLALLVLLTAGSGLASARCSSDRIQRLADKGMSTSEIAEKCHMSESSVKEALDSDDDDGDDSGAGHNNNNNNSNSQGLPSGTQVGQCGCWGIPPAQVSHPRCASGRAVPRMCGGACPLGGSPWVGVCE